MTIPELDTPTARDARPHLGFRVGITGHRKLGKADVAALEAAVGRVLDEAEHALRSCLDDPASRHLYRGSDPMLRLVSPLAVGADRLVARVAVARGWRLAVPLPFPRNEYENDFRDSLDEFDALLAHAEAHDEVVQLDGQREAENDAYTEVGHFVVRHSDLLIAIWNGEKAAGPGGAGDIVAAARSLGVPVVHIHSHAPHVSLLLPDDGAEDATEPATVAAIVRALVLPKWPVGHRRHAAAARTHFLSERVGVSDMAPDFLHRGPFSAPPTVLGRVFPWFIRRLGGPPRQNIAVVDALPPAGADNAVVRACFLHFQRADVLASHYAHVHRSSFVLIYLFGFLSVVATFTGQFTHGVMLGHWNVSTLTTLAEAVFLLCILGLVWIERVWRWRERWLDYRMLAEMIRQTDLLVQIGGVPLTGCLDKLSEMHPERGWVPWLAAALTRSMGLVGARYDAEYLTRVRDYAARTRLPDQIAYHERTSARNATVSAHLRTVSVAMFALTGVALGLELMPGEAMPGTLLSWLAGVLPALGAASVGIRNQAEFEIVVHRSDRLRERLGAERQRIARLTGERLTSTSLSRAIQQGARLMQTDTAEWAAIFEVKESEVG